MDLLRCVLCELNEGHAEPLYPHDHAYGQIPQTPCRACYVRNCDYCSPLAPYWCSCDCGLGKDDK